MRFSWALIVGLCAATPLAAQSSFPELEDCALHPIGTEFCSPEIARDALDGLEPAWGFHFRGGGADAFAIVTVLGQVRQGLENRISGGECIVNDEIAFSVNEIWAMYVSLNDDMTEQMFIDFNTMERFVGHAVAYIAEGACA